MPPPKKHTETQGIPRLDMASSRLKEAGRRLNNAEAEEMVIRINELLAPMSIFWGDDDGEPWVSWGGVPLNGPRKQSFTVTVSVP